MKRATQKMTHARQRENDLSGLGLDPRIVVEKGEKPVRFALGSSQFLVECLQ